MFSSNKLHQPSDTTGRIRWLICLFFVFILLLGLWTTPHYGLPWDTLDEMDILRMNLWEYCQLLGINDDAFQRLAAQRLQAEALNPYIADISPISQNPHQDHGEAAYYPLAGVVMSQTISPAHQTLVWHLYTWFLFWLGMIALYHICRQLGTSRMIAFAAVAMLLLSPRFFAEGHYNNKDIVFMTLVLLTLWQCLRLMQKPAWATGVLFAFAGALATSTKIAGVAIFLLCGGFVLLFLLVQKRFTARHLRIGVVTLGCFVLFYALLTPALWRNPIGFVRYLAENAMNYTIWQGYVLFRGTVYNTALTQLPKYYLPYMMLTTIPPWILLCIGGGQLSTILFLFQKKNKTPEKLVRLLISLLWLIPLGFAVLTGTRVYNGWRHFYFLYGPMLVLSALGLSQLFNRLREKKPGKLPRRLAAGLLALCMGASCLSLLRNHPYQYAYFNIFPQLESRQSISAYLERDYWNVSVANALKQLSRQLRDDPGVNAAGVPSSVDGVDLWSRLGVLWALEVDPDATNPLLMYDAQASESPTYLLASHTYQNFSQWEPSPHWQPIVVLEAYGHPLVTIYQNTATAMTE